MPPVTVCICAVSVTSGAPVQGVSGPNSCFKHDLIDQDCHCEMGGNISRRAAFCKMIEHACCSYHDGPHVLGGDANVRSASLDGPCSQQASYQGYCKRHHCHTSDSTDSTSQNLPSAQSRSQSSRHHDVLSPGVPVVRPEIVCHEVPRSLLSGSVMHPSQLGIQARGARLRACL
jgi:hypothetical protein